MRHLVLGATGFLGSHLVEHLACQGEEVQALVRPGSDASLLQRLGVAPLEGDVRDEEALRGAVRGADVVYNCAAVTEEGRAHEAYQAVNVQALHALLRACRGQGLRRIVHLSCVAVYGPGLPGQPVDELHRQRPATAYQRSKAEAEVVASAYLGQPDLPISVLRSVRGFGPRDRYFTQRLVELYRTNPHKPLISGGRAPLSLIYGRDVARALHLLATDERAVGQTYLVKGFDTTWRDFIGGLCHHLGLPPPSRSLPYPLARLAALGEARAREGQRPALSRCWVDAMGRPQLFDDRRIRLELGSQPQYDLESALAETAAWLRTLDAGS